MTGENKRATNPLSVGLKRKKGVKRGHLGTLTHGLYLRPGQFRVDYRTKTGKTLLEFEKSLLERFNGDVPAVARMLASRTAFKLVRASSYETMVANSKESPSPRAENDYLKLSASIRNDISLLNSMARDTRPLNPKEETDLENYLKTKATPGQE